VLHLDVRSDGEPGELGALGELPARGVFVAPPGFGPFIAIAGIVLFLLPIVLLVLGLAFGAYYLTR
jgi:hypothetical protein